MDIGRLASNLEDLQNSTQPTLHSHDNCYVSTTKLAAVLRPGADVRKVTLSGWARRRLAGMLDLRAWLGHYVERSESQEAIKTRSNTSR